MAIQKNTSDFGFFGTLGDPGVWMTWDFRAAGRQAWRASGRPAVRLASRAGWFAPTLVKQFKSHPHAILCVAARAGHLCFFESFWASNWASRATQQFALRAAANK